MLLNTHCICENGNPDSEKGSPGNETSRELAIGNNVEEKLLTQDKCLFHVPLCLGVYIHVYTVTAIMHYE